MLSIANCALRGSPRVRFVQILFALAVLSTPAAAASVSPAQAQPGSTITLTDFPCAAPQPASLILDQRAPLAAATTDKAGTWTVTLPATDLPPKTYALTWKCGTAAAQSIAGAPTLDVRNANDAPVAMPTVTNVVVLKPHDPDKPLEARLGDTLELTVDHLADWKKVVANAKKELHLFIDGTELPNVSAVVTSQDLSTLHVVLEVDNSNTDRRRAWVSVLKAFTDKPDHQSDVSVGPAGEPPFPTSEKANKIRIEVFPRAYTIVVVVGLVILVVGIVVLGKQSALLRDGNGVANAPYSLAKHQMAVWFVVIVGSYLYIWLITGLFSSISSTALILIGVSGATGLAAVVIDNGKRQEAQSTFAALTAEQTALNQTLNAPGTGLQAQLAAAAAGSPAALQLSATIGAKLARFNEVTSLLAAGTVVPAQNQTWIMDLLSDENGVSFHRLQMLVWTLVLVMVFVKAVHDNILMPEFDATLLGLMGISSGTYLGFKFPEKVS